MKMENCTTVSGRRRGPTKHSVEDQALDQIAKEKLANLAKTADAGDAPGTEPGNAPGSSSGGSETGNGEKGGNGEESSGSSCSSPSIPDRFFGDVPETNSSGGSCSEESGDTDEGAASDVSNDKEKLNESGPPRSCSPPRPVRSGIDGDDNDDDCDESPERIGADIADLRNGNNGSGGNIAEVIDEIGTVDVREVELNDGTCRGNEDDGEGSGRIESVYLKEVLKSNELPEKKDGCPEEKEDDDDGDVDGEEEEEEDGFFAMGNRRISGLSDMSDYLEELSELAEARLAAKRQARVEAREIRSRELERQQKEQEENADRAFDMSYSGDSILRTGRIALSATALNARDRALASANSYHSSRRSSEDSIEEGLTLRDIRHELKETEEKFKKAMIANAQLDNEKSALAYQVELLKDRFEDLEETHAQLAREHRDKCREHEQLKRGMLKLKEEMDFYKSNLLERDLLITEYGLVIVDGEEDGEGRPKRTLVSAESAELLQQAGAGSLDVRLKKFSEERNELQDEIRHLKLELEEERSKRMSDTRTSLTNGPLDEETNKILSDYKFKLQKAEQDVSTLQANVARLESQVIRYKTAAESSEKAEDELKIEKRKLQRENRESIARIEELETANSHLQRRMDKLKNAKSTLLKEL